MSILGRIFGSKEVIETGVEGIYNGVDKVVYTDEEKADNFARLLKLYEPFKVAQRLIALMVGIPFVFLHIVISLVWLQGLIVIDNTEVYLTFTERVSTFAMANNQTLGEPFGYIVIFYFCGGMGEGVVRAYLERRK